MEELLKNLGFSDEQIQKVIGGMQESKIYTTTEEKIEERYNKLKNQKIELDNQIKTANSTIESYKNSNFYNEDLQNKIGEYEAKVNEYEKQIQDIKVNYALEETLKDANVRNAKVVKSLLNMENIKIDGENISGLKEQIEELKNSDSYLFENTVTGCDLIDGKSNPSSQETTSLRSALTQKYQ